MALPLQTDEQYYLGPDGIWNSWDEDYGNYQFTSIKDIINNFIISYVGEEKIIPKAKRTDVAFHAQRGVQEFSFDILPSVKSQEIEIGPNLNFILPKDYVNYVKITWTDSNGIERVVYPAINTSNPFPILQDNNYEYLFDEQDEEYKSSVLPSDCVNRLAIEAGVTDFWWRYLSSNGAVIGIDQFGLSAPADELFEYLMIEQI